MKTRSRNGLITQKSLSHRRYIYIDCGNTLKRITLIPQMIGHKFGEYGVTKKLGSTIHNSKRNEKRLQKKNKKK